MKSSAYLLLRTGHFVWWSFGFGLTALGLACMTGVPLLARDRRPIDLMGRINDGDDARRIAGMIGAWCGVAVQRVDGLPDVTPFNFDRV